MPHINAKPYPPGDANILGDVCIPVFVPNDFYAIAAFWGAYESLGQWTGWARTGDRRGTEIAQRFRQSIADSRELSDRLEGNLSPLEINVNCGGSGACCSPLTIDIDTNIHLTDGEYSDWQGLPVGEIVYSDDVPTGFADAAAYLTYKCKAANIIADDIQTTLTLTSLSLAALVTLEGYALRTSVFGSLPTWVAGTAGLSLAATGGLALAAGAVILLLATSAGAHVILADMLDDLFDADIVEAIYNAEDETTARAAVAQVIVDAADSNLSPSALFRDEILGAIRQIAKFFFTEDVYRIAFNQADVITNHEDPDDAVDCSTFDGPTFDPSGPMPDASSVTMQHYFRMEQNLSLTEEVTSDTLAKFGTINLVTGIQDYATEINSSGAYFAQSSPGSNYNLDDSGFTIALWVKILDTSVNSLMMNKANLVTSKSWRIGYNASINTFFIAIAYTGSSEAIVSATSYAPISQDVWYFLVARTASASSVELSLNDGAWDSGSVTTPFHTNVSYPFEIGAWSNRAFYSAMEVDEMSIWSDKLSDDQITWLYNSGNGRSYSEF